MSASGRRERDWHRFPVFGAVEPKKPARIPALPWRGLVVERYQGALAGMLERVGWYKADALRPQRPERPTCGCPRWRCAGCMARPSLAYLWTPRTSCGSANSS